MNHNSNGPGGVIFDLDGVLADVDYRAASAFFTRLLPISLAELGRVWQRWLDVDVKAATARDATVWAQFWDALADRYNLDAPSRRQLHQFDYRSLYRPFPDAAPALDALKRRGLRIAVLSNTPLVDLRELLGAMELAHLVDSALFPQNTGVAKPDAAAYLGAAAALGVAPGRALFFDDDPVNVAGALSAGLRAFRVDRTGTATAGGVVRDLSDIHRLIDA